MNQEASTVSVACFVMLFQTAETLTDVFLLTVLVETSKVTVV